MGATHCQAAPRFGNPVHAVKMSNDNLGVDAVPAIFTTYAHELFVGIEPTVVRGGVVYQV
jgi:hypothetical protein